MTAGTRIVVVDDDRSIRRLLATLLAPHGFVVTEAEDGRHALATIASSRPDLVLLDLGLPDIDGLDVLVRVREWSQVPVIVLSVRHQEVEKVTALDRGADDYVTKPFAAGELLARIRSALRRAKAGEAEPVLRFGGLTVDLARRLVTRGESTLALTPTEYDLLRLLATNAGRVLTHRQILLALWGPGYANQSHLIRVNISNLRQKLEESPEKPILILTEPGVGYRFREVDAPGSQGDE